ncbi:MAG: phosphoribosylaminoimidazolesuccinocarboxamide synthase [Actinomyces sp.]|jgi:phosphoribosylaminoimidazole-succinocarboxamide synthase|nr:phosphoribosylaminoimidazolesuccinocarboxamide synthase [Actinomyces sp.]MCI1642616.1 phosphoribosylaminoimidazolesuccinocarboxamide synthase [Actinomyces sp.]MCI1691825.1 phosphoribosylaminoimidazolesuccinocarboxamide synthase [Actinomyces sp.]MCI1787191.1 phosphoribosylaminoimidazolesuccinocarboxamide synthase [Actinomyces sp.]MCI1829585.1 phosphoribosylaminoimidazolesuccinocarboxamide synthase [Actinomyces sp.]MCI1866857.1 phosphoribosylaminoimidazolesuccinocarboxamide synthase [Actinomy
MTDMNGSPAPDLPGWVHLSSGKVRDIYAPVEDTAPDSAPAASPGARGAARPRHLLMVTSDRISAYDHILPSLIPDKGKVLNQLALWWMGRLEDIVPNHVVSTDAGGEPPVPEEVAGRAVVCRALAMAPIECVVRGYLTGSGLADYRATGTVCGVALPPGLVEASRLPEPIFTPAAKAQLGSHDENISFARVVELVGEDLASRLREISLALYRRAAEIAAARGVLIADTKFEFGVDRTTGQVVLADEILTPDSSRFWPADQWAPGEVTPSFDKQYVRDWLTSPASGWDRGGDAEPPALPPEIVAATRERYLEAFRRITGEEPRL